jgi:hypothetical protein
MKMLTGAPPPPVHIHYSILIRTHSLFSSYQCKIDHWDRLLPTNTSFFCSVLPKLQNKERFTLKVWSSPRYSRLLRAWSVSAWITDALFAAFTTKPSKPS